MCRGLLVLLCCSVLFLSDLAPAPAEDSDRPSSTEAYRAKVATLGAPTAEAGFRFAGVLLLNGQRAGHARISALPMKAKDGTLRWRAKDALMLKIGAKTMVRVATAQFDSHLNALQGSVRSVNLGEPEIDWVRTDTGIRTTQTTRTEDGTEETVRNFNFDDTALCTLASSALFCRTVLEQPGRYATNVLEVRDALKGKPILQVVVFHVEGKVTLPGGHEVIAVTGTKGDETLRLLFDPKTHMPVALRLQTPQAKIEILAADKWQLPATSAKGAALRTALGLATGNLEILDDVTHWALLYRRAASARSEEDKKKAMPDLETFRKAQLETWKNALPKNDATVIKGFLEELKDQIKFEQREGGLVLATFPEVFNGLRVLLVEEGGIWSLVALTAKQ